MIAGHFSDKAAFPGLKLCSGNSCAGRARIDHFVGHAAAQAAIPAGRGLFVQDLNQETVSVKGKDDVIFKKLANFFSEQSLNHLAKHY
ncbi:MAG: hypothetical protein LBO66_15355 [Deltaproteobacteria bacterium]|nr:hypothetical protein [Deltaproteobacteria bacterium]